MRELKIERTITTRDSASVGKYLSDISRITLLTTEEEILLTRMIKAGDSGALERLVETNLRFVVSVAKNYQNRGLGLGDLINEGNLGLIKAANKFDETKGFKFISFAVWWIRQAIILAIAEQTRTIRLPLNMVSAITKINKVTSRLEQKFERLPSPEEIAWEVNMERSKINDYLQRARLSVSLDAALNEETGSTLLDVVSDHHPATDYLTMQAGHNEDIDKMFRTLSKREVQVLKLFFGIGIAEPMSLDDIALLLNLSRERIRQLKDCGLNKLRYKAHRKTLYIEII
jgi:RNA polymerase primary sigma factor